MQFWWISHGKFSHKRRYAIWIYNGMSRMQFDLRGAQFFEAWLFTWRLDDFAFFTLASWLWVLGCKITSLQVLGPHIISRYLDRCHNFELLWLSLLVVLIWFFLPRIFWIFWVFFVAVNIFLWGFFIRILFICFILVFFCLIDCVISTLLCTFVKPKTNASWKSFMHV